MLINKFESEVVSFSVHCLMTWYVYNSSHNCIWNNIVVVLLVLVKICHIMTQKVFYVMHYFWSIICPLEVRCLTPLSKIFQLLLLRRKLKYPEKSRSVASHWHTLSHTVLSSTPRHEWGSNSQLKWWYAMIAQGVVNSTTIRPRRLKFS